MARFIATVTAVVLLVFLAPAQAAEEERGQGLDPFFVETGVTGSTGDFGTAVDTTLVWVPFTFGYRTERLEVSATIPYIALSTTGFTTPTLGGPAAVSETPAAQQPSPQVPNPTPTQPSPVIATEASTDPTSGLGDLTLSGTYLLIEQEGPWPSVSPWASVKIPTADKDKGLGTGEVDFGFGAIFDVARGRLFASADLGYIIIGEPSGVDFDNVFAATLIGGLIPLDRLTLYALFDYRTAVVKEVDDPIALGFGANYPLGNAFLAKGELRFGLTESAADLAWTTTLQYRF
jgi:hypothetical protein